jgi:hypothetical protein
VSSIGQPLRDGYVDDGPPYVETFRDPAEGLVEGRVDEGEVVHWSEQEGSHANAVQWHAAADRLGRGHAQRGPTAERAIDADDQLGEPAGAQGKPFLAVVPLPVAGTPMFKRAPGAPCPCSLRFV